jgi:acetyl esterase/lipase
VLAGLGAHRRSGGPTLYAGLSFGGCAFDFYKQSTRRACIIGVHGGAWTGGSRTSVTTTAEALRDRGWPVFNTTYPLCDPEAPDPQEPIDHIMAFIQHVRANADFYNIDETLIGGLGFSAGGHLLMMAATTGVAGDTKPDAVCTLSSPLRLETLTSSGASGAATYMGVAYAANNAAWHAKSPYHTITEDCPPIRLVNNDSENVAAGGIATDQPDDMETAALAVSVDVTKLIKVGTLHPVSGVQEAALMHDWFRTKLGGNW